MPKLNQRIEIVRTEVIENSSMSKDSAMAIAKVLSKHYTNVRVSDIDTIGDLTLLAERNPDLVFLGMSFVQWGTKRAHKIWLTDFLEEHSIPYTGSNQASRRLESHKGLAKQRILDNGLATSPFHVIARKTKGKRVTATSELTFPLFVKPVDKGGGQGVDEDSVVHNLEELHNKVTSIHDVHQTDALVEEYLVGREFSVAVIRTQDTEELVAMPIEIVADKDSNGQRILSNLIKAADTEKVYEVTDAGERSLLMTLATDVFKALGARDYGRIDIRFDHAGVPHFLEANLIPSLIKNYGNFPKALKLNKGIGYEKMILDIVQLAASRAV